MTDLTAAWRTEVRFELGCRAAGYVIVAVSKRLGLCLEGSGETQEIITEWHR